MANKPTAREDGIKRRTTRAGKGRLAAARAGRIVLSGRDGERVLKLLQNPPKPAPPLLAAARRRSART